MEIHSVVLNKLCKLELRIMAGIALLTLGHESEILPIEAFDVGVDLADIVHRYESNSVSHLFLLIEITERLRSWPSCYQTYNTALECFRSLESTKNCMSCNNGSNHPCVTHG